LVFRLPYQGSAENLLTTQHKRVSDLLPKSADRSASRSPTGRDLENREYFNGLLG
jgi:hypothetical protein